MTHDNGVDAGTANGIPQTLREVVDLVEDRKGYDLVVLDLRELASFTDYMVICTGRSERHVQAVVDAILEAAREQKRKPLHTEGYEQGNWVLVDFVDHLINVFTPETRDFYQLERLWRDAPDLVGEGFDMAPHADSLTAEVGDDSAPEDPGGQATAAAEAGDG